MFHVKHYKLIIITSTMLKSIPLNLYTKLSNIVVGQSTKLPLKHDLVVPTLNIMNVCSSFE